MELEADCGRCAALCCVALAFDRSSSFAFDKPAGVPCPLLTANDRCGIHAQLERRGFGGCARYDCFGAGQRVTELLGGRARDEPAVLEAFATARELHELFALLTTAGRLPLTQEQSETREALAAALDDVSLQAFARSDLGRRTRGFLRSLRRGLADVATRELTETGQLLSGHTAICCANRSQGVIFNRPSGDFRSALQSSSASRSAIRRASSPSKSS